MAYLDVLPTAFDRAIAALAAARAPAAVVAGPMRAAWEIICRHLQKPWKLVLTDQVELFHTSGVQRELRLNPDAFGRLLASIVRQTEQPDRALADLMAAFPDEEARVAAIVEAFISLFLAHELFHIDQRLGSDQYRDSDDYMPAVGVLDYQADVVALWIVGQVIERPAELPPQDRILFLMALHIFAMNAFCESEEPRRMDRPTFDRLLIWLFQAARVARARQAPDMLHPSVQAAPTVTLPRFADRITESVAAETFSARGNREGEIRQDLVVTLADGRGIQRLYRLSSTDEARGASLAKAAFEGDFAAARAHFEELFHQYDASLDFGVADAVVHEIEAAAMAADRLTEPGGPQLALEDPAVQAFFQRAESLILMRPNLPGPISEYRERWAQGSWRDLERALSGIESTDAKRLNAELRHEIRRIGIFLRLALEGL